MFEFSGILLGYKQMRKQKIVFAGVARDCEKYLAKVLENVDRLASLFQEAAFVFVENDSKDDTKRVLSDWGKNKNNFHLINLDGLGNIPVRTLRLEMARNVYLELIKNHPRLNGHDYLCVLDMDNVSSRPIEVSAFEAALDFLEAAPDNAGVFANQNGTYYDMWALLHKELCPVDIWEEVLDYALAHNVSDQEAFDQTFAKRILSIDPSSPPIEVDSAFGGLGIYKMQYVINNPNQYLGSRVKVHVESDGSIKIFRMQTCDHPNFNMGVRNQGGRLFILPWLINGENSGLSFHCSAFRGMIF